MAGRAGGVRVPWALALLAAWGCDYVRPDEVFVPDAEVVAIGAVLEAGTRRAHLLASHPHAPGSAARPVVGATLIGPGVEAAYDRTVDAIHCGVISERSWPGPHVCMEATLPQPVAEGATYTLTGTTSLGSFRGETRVPGAVTVLEPLGDVTTTLEEDPFRRFARVSLRFAVPADVALVMPTVANAVQVVDSAGQSSERRIALLLVVPEHIDRSRSRADVEALEFKAEAPWMPPEVGFDLHLLGLDEHYGRLESLREDPMVITPWPFLGLEGDAGIVGYFGSVSNSGPVHVRVGIGR